MVGDVCNGRLCSWGSNALQSCQVACAKVANGLLTITAKKGPIVSKNQTSARLRISNLGGQWTHRRFEARIKTVPCLGSWPAFWMLPNTSVAWHAGGEIDIQESTGQRAMCLCGTIHERPSNGAYHRLGTPVYTQPGTLADEFHVHAVEWTPNKISSQASLIRAWSAVKVMLPATPNSRA